MKIFTLQPNENWIVDHMADEWRSFSHPDLEHVNSPYNADIIWGLADWAWNKIPYQLLQSKTVVMTVHHIVPEKFENLPAEKEFHIRDAIVDFYHVFNEHTKKYLIEHCKINSSRIVLIPYWCNDKFWVTGEVKNSKSLLPTTQKIF